MISDQTIKEILVFRDAREWRQFHNGKDLAISINLEASELLELFQWSGTDIDAKEKVEAMKEELADIVMYSILFADAYGINLDSALLAKLEQNNKKYPVNTSKGKKHKYTELK